MRPVLIALSLAGCGSRAQTPPPPHADVDRVLFAKDPPPDAGPDASVDAGPDAPPILWDGRCNGNPLAKGCF